MVSCDCFMLDSVPTTEICTLKPSSCWQFPLNTQDTWRTSWGFSATANPTSPVVCTQSTNIFSLPKHPFPCYPMILFWLNIHLTGTTPWHESPPPTTHMGSHKLCGALTGRESEHKDCSQNKATADSLPGELPLTRLLPQTRPSGNCRSALRAPDAWPAYPEELGLTLPSALPSLGARLSLARRSPGTDPHCRTSCPPGATPHLPQRTRHDRAARNAASRPPPPDTGSAARMRARGTGRS